MSFIPFLYVCNLQSAIYVPVSLTVNSFSSFQLPPCPYFPPPEEELSTMFSLLGLHCIVTVRLSLSLPVVFDRHTCLLSTKKRFSCLSLFLLFAVRHSVLLGSWDADHVCCTDNNLYSLVLAGATLLVRFSFSHIGTTLFNCKASGQVSVLYLYSKNIIKI